MINNKKYNILEASICLLSELYNQEQENDLSTAIRLAAQYLKLDVHQKFVDCKINFLSSISSYSKWHFYEYMKQTQAIEEISKLSSLLCLSTLFYYELFSFSKRNLTAHSRPIGAIIHLSIANVRTFIHSPLSSCSLQEIRGRYLYIAFLTKSLVHSMLHEIGLLPSNEFSTTLGRSTVLIPYSKIELFQNNLSFYQKEIQLIWPLLKLNLSITPLSTHELNSEIMKSNILNFNPSIKDISKDRHNFIFKDSYVGTVENKEYFKKLTEKIDKYPKVTLYQCTKSKAIDDTIETCLLLKHNFPITFTPFKSMRKKKGISMAVGSLISRNPTTYINLMMSLHDLSLVHSSSNDKFCWARLDVCGLSKQIMEQSNDDFNDQFLYCNRLERFFRIDLVNLIEKNNETLFPQKQIYLIHSISDDVVLFGAYSSLHSLIDKIKLQYSQIFHGRLDKGISILRKETSDKQLAHEALLDLMNRRNN